MLNAISDYQPLVNGMEVAVLSADIVQSSQAGSHYAFEELQKKYSQRLFKQIIAITRHYEDAEDALQDALCKAYVALPLFEHRSHVYTWMSRIAINCALMKIRKRANYRELSLDGPNLSEDQDSVPEPPHPGWSPEDICGSEERLGQIANLMESLDPISKRVLSLRANEEYSMEEIADALNVSVSAAKARLYRARHVLRVFLPERFNVEIRG
jgi:RNA polymerase sigma-70 factor, ECF subfamily